MSANLWMVRNSVGGHGGKAGRRLGQMPSGKSAQHSSDRECLKQEVNRCSRRISLRTDTGVQGLTISKVLRALIVFPLRAQRLSQSYEDQRTNRSTRADRSDCDMNSSYVLAFTSGVQPTLPGSNCWGGRTKPAGAQQVERVPILDSSFVRRGP
jgi:hypothetical protein